MAARLVTPQELLQEFGVRLGFLHPDLQFILEDDVASYSHTLRALLGTTQRTLWQGYYVDLLHGNLTGSMDLGVNWELATQLVVRLVADHERVLKENIEA